MCVSLWEWKTHPLGNWHHSESPCSQTIRQGPETKTVARGQWLMPVILAIQEAEIRRIMV
jgi:hypothetical protein